MLAVVAVGPAIEPAILHRGQIVRHQVRPDFIALVGDGPELACLGLPLQPGWIANAGSVEAMCPGRYVHLPDCGSLTFGLHSVFGDIAVGTHSDVELRTIRTGEESLGPMVIDRPTWKVGQLGSLVRDAGLSVLIGIADNCIGVRHVEIVTDQRDAKRRVQMVQKYSSQFRNAVAFGVPQKCDAVCVGGLCARKSLYNAGDEILRTKNRGLRSITLYYQSH